jgi:superfamily I DNA/RNA helicase
VQKEIAKLVERILPSEIAILHTEKHVRDTYRSLVPKDVKVDDLRRQTGMEYKVVFIPHVQQLFSGGDTSFDYKQAIAEHQLGLYMAMTRARDNVYLLFGSKWPKEFEAVRSYVDWLDG